MFKGQTNITVTEATVIEALQQWMDERTDASARKNIIKSVEQTRNGYDDGFKLKLEEVIAPISKD